MIIHSGLITLDYNPTKDILVTGMPDVKQFALPEVAYCLNLIIDTVNSYHVRNLLIDSSKSVVEVDDQAYKAAIQKFGMDLMSTRLNKIARVATTDAKREQKSAKISQELKEELNLPIAFRNFTSLGEALEWLEED